MRLSYCSSFRRAMGRGGDVISQLDGYFLGMENRIREYIDRGKFVLNLGY